jgi:multiple sugar transport system substrate-binding protein
MSTYANKIVRRLAAAILVSALLLSCTQPGQQSPVTLNLIGEALPPFQAIPEVTREFTEKTGIRVEIHPYEFETALSKTQLDFTGNTGNYDVVMGIYFNLGKYVENNDILELSPFMVDASLHDPEVKLDNFFKPVLDVSCYYKGKLYGLPATAQTMFLWYRRDLFEHPEERAAFQQRYGYPLPVPDAEKAITWDQYRDLAEFFTRKKGERLAGQVLSEDFYGTCLQAKRHPALWYEFGNYLSSFGGEIVDGRENVTVNSPQVVEALNFYISLKKFSPPGTLQYTWDDALTAFQQGRIALTTMWFDATPSLDDPNSSRVVSKVGYGLIPVKTGVDRNVAQYGGWAFYINADSKHPREAYQLIQWLNRPDVQLKWAKSGGLPSTISTFEDPEYLAIPYHPAERQALNYTVAWTRAPYSEEINSKGIEALSRAVSGQEDPKRALDWLADEIKKIQTSRRK